MKFQKRDKNFRDLINLTASQTKRPISEVEDTIEIYTKIISQLIEWDKPVTIHIDYIGDLVYNQKWADKVKEIKNARSNEV